MSDPASSPEVSQEDNEEEQVDIGDVEEEEEDSGEEVGGDDIEEENVEGQEEGIDLDMAEESEDDPDGEMGVPNGERRKAGVTKLEEKHEANAGDLLSQPPHGSEVFVGGISKDTTEDDLRELCAPCGDVYEVRLLKDKEKGDNKSYAFVTFFNKETAEKAIETLNNSEVKGKKLRFSHSQSKHRIFIGNVPKNWEQEELEKAVAEKGPGIQSIELLKDPQNQLRNRGFAFVEYYNHACAENARKNMSKSSFKLGSNTPTVSWADPRSVPDSATMSQIKAVYVRNLPDSVTEEQLRKLFERHGEIAKVVLPLAKPGQPKRDFGFIHFSDRSSALKAIEKTEKYELEDRVLETSLAKPPTEKKSDSSYPLQRSAGILSQYQARVGYGYSASDMYGNSSAAYGSTKGYGQPQPAGMAMVPVLLPDGRVGYVLQQPGTLQGGSAPYRTGRTGHEATQNRQGGGSSRRYHPY